MDGSHAQVLEGLQADDVVILYPNDVVEDGSLVEERANARCRCAWSAAPPRGNALVGTFQDRTRPEP